MEKYYYKMSDNKSISLTKCKYKDIFVGAVGCFKCDYNESKGVLKDKNGYYVRCTKCE